MQKNGPQRIANFVRDARREAAQHGKVLGALRLAFQALAGGHLAVEGRGAGGHLLAEREHGGRPVPFQERIVVDPEDGLA